MTIVFVGIDLAKNVFALHGVDDAGKARLVRPAVRRDQLLETIAKLAPCTIGMEALGLTLLGKPVEPVFGFDKPCVSALKLQLEGVGTLGSCGVDT